MTVITAWLRLKGKVMRRLNVATSRESNRRITSRSDCNMKAKAINWAFDSIRGTQRQEISNYWARCRRMGTPIKLGSWDTEYFRRMNLNSRDTDERSGLCCLASPENISKRSSTTWYIDVSTIYEKAWFVNIAAMKLNWICSNIITLHIPDLPLILNENSMLIAMHCLS